MVKIDHPDSVFVADRRVVSGLWMAGGDAPSKERRSAQGWHRLGEIAVKRKLVSASVVATLLSSNLPAQTVTPLDVTNAQAIATLNGANIKNSNDRTTEDLAVLKAIQEASAGGSGGGADYAKSAEALLVSHYAMVGAAGKLAASFTPNPARRVLVVWGGVPPATGAYIQFAHDVTLIGEALNNATQDWTRAYELSKPKPKPKPRGKPQRINPSLGPGGGGDGGQAAIGTAVGAVASSNPVGLAITTALTLASIGRVDTTVNGVEITTDQEQSRAIVATALKGARHDVDFTEFDLAAVPTEDQLGLKPLIQKYRIASTLYRQQYLPALAATDNKTNKLSAVEGAAGAELTAAIGAADSLRKAAFTSTNGVSSATALYAVKQLIEARTDKTIVFLRSMRTAATVRGNKGFFVGITRSPADFEAASAIDYLILDPSADGTGRPRATSGQAVFYTGVVHLWKLNEFLRACPAAGSGPFASERPRTPPAAGMDRAGSGPNDCRF